MTGSPRIERTPIRWHASMHWAYNEPGWLGFIAEIEHGTRYLVRHELTFLRQVPETAAAEITAFIRTKYLRSLSSILLQPDLFPHPDSRGETVSTTFSRFGLPMRRGTGDRIAGWSRLRSMLEPVKIATGFLSPAIVIHQSCRRLLGTLPSLMSERNRDDILLTPDDFPARALAYFAMSRPGVGSPVAQALARHPDAIGHDVEALRASLRRSGV